MALHRWRTSLSTRVAVIAALAAAISAASLGSTLNTASPAFAPYQPSPFLRAFDLGTH